MHEKQTAISDFSDEVLMQLICNGNVRAFDELYYRYSASLMRYFVRMLNFNKELAEDALQDLFLKIAESPEKFDSNRTFKTWIYSVASNSCKNFYRHKSVMQKNEPAILFENAHFNENEFVMLASKIDGQNFRKMLNETLECLSVEKKEAFILKYQEDKTIAEIAAIQGCPEGSVKSRIHYTIKILEEQLKIFKPVA